jgi:ABC-2 type transport system permease protein
VVVVALCGLLVGWAPHGSVLDTFAAFGLLLLMAFAMTWAGMWVGLKVRDPDGADGIVMSIIFPAMFLSGIFVPVAGLRQIAQLNPLTALPPRCASCSARPPARCRTCSRSSTR